MLTIKVNVATVARVQAELIALSEVLYHHHLLSGAAKLRTIADEMDDWVIKPRQEERTDNDTL